MEPEAGGGGGGGPEVHEQEHDREICELIVQHEKEIKELHAKLKEQQQLQQQMEAAHKEEKQQAEALHNLKLEALRLNSNNIHTSQLELMETNLRKEKETALMELREMLNDKHAQEVAVLQGQCHFQLERIKEQHDKKKEEMALKHLGAIVEHENLKNQYDLAMTKLQAEHEQKLEGMEEQSKKQEGELQQEIEKLKAMQQKLKAESEEEIKRLWSQLDSARASRQELSELKEQLLARTSHMEEMENLKKDFQLKWDKKKSEHEKELEQLRLYFEQKLKSVEENYREELTMLHQRLQDMKDSSLLEVENSQDLPVEFGSSTALLEEMTEKERHDLFEQLTQQLERHKEELSSLQLHLDDKHRSEVELLRCSLTLQYEESLKKMRMDLSDRFTSEIEQLKRKHCLSLEQLRAKMSEEHLREIAELHLQSAQDAAFQVEMEVAEQCLALENEYKAKLGVLQVEMQSQKEDIEELRRENTKLKEVNVCQEMHWKEELEQIKCKLIEDHANELQKAREQLQEMEQTHKAKAEEWKQEEEELRRKAEEKLALLCKELESKAEHEQQALQRQSEFREAEMIWLQQQQAARIVELEKSLKEQQNSVQQLEDTLANAQKTVAQYDSELTSTKTLMTEELEKTQAVLQEEWKAKLKDAQRRLVEEHEAVTKTITREHEILFEELRKKHTEELNFQSTELQHQHKEHISSLTSILQTKHQAEMETLKAVLERKQQALETQIADMQNNHQAQITELETKHLSNLDSLESAYVSEIQLLRDEHRQALEDLWVDFRDQLLQKETENQMLLAQVDKMKLQHAEELQICQDSLKIELTTVHTGKLKALAAELEEAHKEDLTAVLGKQQHLLKDDYHKALEVQREEILHMEKQYKKAMQELQDIHRMEVNQGKENCQHLQKEMEEKVKLLDEELEDANAELKNLLQQRERENQEGETLMALLRSDVDICSNERKKLQESYQQALKLLLKMVKAAKDTEDLIYKKIGLGIDESLASGDSGESRSIIGEIVLAQNHKSVEKWSVKTSSRVPNQTLPEHSFESSLPDEASELSEHLCESIFENPDLVFENEERIHKICHCLHIAVEKLLELVAESTKQVEETHKIHIHYEEELKRRNWEACQVVHERHELMDCLNEESEAKNNLALELHKARGLIEGYLTERQALEEALHLKEESECHLVAELENLKAQLQELTQEHARSLEEQKLLISQKKALAANVGEREDELLKEIEHLAKAKLELQCQVEKDCSNLNSQMKILEMELEEQLNKNQKITAMSLEVTDLRQQIQALERQLKNQRDFMDKQAVEREHERDEFQEEIHKLEMQLKVTRKSQAVEQSRVYEVETLHNEIKEKTEDYNLLFLDKEQMQKDLAVQKEDIEKLESRVRELECMKREEAENVNKLTQELQKMKKKEAELEQDKEALQQQQYDHLIQISTLQSKLDEVRHRVLSEGSLDPILMEQLKAQEELRSKNGNVLETEDLKSVVEHICGDNEQLLKDKTEEIEQLYKVIEKLQNELTLHEISDSPDSLNNVTLVEQEENLHDKLKRGPPPCHPESGGEGDNRLSLNPSQKQLQGQLESLLADRETWQQLLEEKESQFKADVELLEQNFRESSRQHFTELTTLQLQYKELQEEHKLLNMRLTQKENDMAVAASCIQELRDKLCEREIKLAEAEKQFQAMSEQKTELAVEVEKVQEKVALLENERLVLAQSLQEKEAAYQREMSELRAAVAELRSRTGTVTEELEAVRSERDFFHAQLRSYREKGQDNDNKELKLCELVPDPVPCVSSEEIEEAGEENEPNNKPVGSAEFSYRDEMEKYITVTDLKSSSKNLNIQDKQGMLLVQGAEITNSVKEHQEPQPLFQQMWQLNHVFQSTQFSQKISENFESRVKDKTSWDSPEIMRKQNNGMELQISLPLTPFSEVDGMHSRGSDSSVLQGDTPGFLECSISYSDGSEAPAANLLPSQHPHHSLPTSAFPEAAFSATDYNGAQENISVRDAEGLTLLLSKLQDDLKSAMSRREGAGTEYGSNASSDLVLQLHREDPEALLHQDSKAMTYLQCFGIVPDITEPARKEREVFSQQLKNVLKMVSEESYKILVLSEKSLPHNDKKNVQKSPSKEGWQKERLALLDIVQSLKDYLSKVPDKEDKENPSAFFDWRGDLLQAVQCVLEKERNMLQSYLQTHFCNSGCGDEGTLIEKLEHIVEQQEQHQKLVLEHLLSSDRNSLLTEIQDLEAELRLMHLQSQEKLQQLQETLINTENHQSKQEHQLRRQVELLEYKLQQEKSIASDLQASLKSEQEKASEMHELLKQEHTAILNLKSDLCESKQTNERLQKSLQQLQNDVIKYSSALESKEKDMTAVLQDYQNEQVKEKELQHMLDEEQHQHKLKEEEKSKAIEELQAALELQCIQNNQLSVALEHEQSANSNLRKELEIEHSRCEALLSQYQNKLLELQKNVDVEKNRSLELLSALKHERVLTEQLSIRINECGSCKHNDSLQELKAQLYKERSHARNLLAIIEKTRQQALDSKKPMGEMPLPPGQPPQEAELPTSLQAAQAALQGQKGDPVRALKTERERQMRKKWEELQSILRSLREQEARTEEGRREIRQAQQAEGGKLQELQKAGESLHELDLQRWQNTGRIKDLQQMLEHWKAPERYLKCHKNQDELPPCPSKNLYTNFTTDTIMPHVEQQKLENIREQLLIAAGCLSELIYKTRERKVNWLPSNDEAIAALLHIVEELKAELLASSKSLIQPTCVTNSTRESEGAAYPEEKPVLQNGWRTTEREETKANGAECASAASSYNPKMQKLYRKYLRAESFRKALVYQKKYLLLLLGGFQECEQATLSLIARMGIYPSPDLTVSEVRSRSFTKFRSAIRVVIAISSTGSTSSASSKDPEHSLTDYIAHLEAIQQRLGMIVPGQSQQEKL